MNQISDQIFIHQSTYSTVKSSLVPSLRQHIFKIYREPVTTASHVLASPKYNTPGEAGSRPSTASKATKRETGKFCIHPPTQLIAEEAHPSGFWILRPQEVAQQEIQELRFNHAKDFEPATTGSRYSSQFEPAHRLLHVPTPFGRQDPSSSKFEGSSLRAGRSAVSQPLRTDCVHSSYL